MKTKLQRLLWKRGEEGVSLVEVLVGIVILSITLLGLAAAGGLAARQLYLGRRDMQLWAAVQQQVEGIVELGFNNVTTGSGNVQGYDMTWTASAPVGNLQQVLFTVDRLDVQRNIVTDTLVIFLTP